MRASKLALFLLAAALPAALVTHGCGSAAPNNSGGTGGEGDTGGKSGGTGGKASTGGKGGATGGSGGATAGAGGGDTGGAGGSVGGAGGSTGGAGGSTGGAGGATGGAGGATGGAGGGGGASGAVACGMGRTKPAGAVIDNFDGGQKVVVEWKKADKMNTGGTTIMPTGSMKITVTGMETHAVGYLAPWAAKDRPCLDASAYMGIQFNATGDVGNLFVRFGTPATYPVVDGGICTDVGSCYAHWQKVLMTPLGTTLVKVPFSELTAPFGTPAPFEKNSLISLVFLTMDTNTAHSFTIDNISFY